MNIYIFNHVLDICTYCVGNKGKLGAYAMKRVGAGAHLANP